MSGSGSSISPPSCEFLLISWKFYGFSCFLAVKIEFCFGTVGAECRKRLDGTVQDLEDKQNSKRESVSISFLQDLVHLA